MVDVPRLLRCLDDCDLSYRSHCFKNTSHNYFDGYDEPAIAAVLDLFTNIVPAEPMEDDLPERILQQHRPVS